MIKLADRFVLEREVGSGGMGRVFLGRDEVLDRPVAVKLLNPVHSNTDSGARFRREGRTAAKLSHPNIVQVYDAGEDELDGQPTSYIVMEYVSGGDLKNLIDERGALVGADIARLSGAAAGLAHAHERGVIHRDIKPHNILLDENRQPKLTDFGIARALDATHHTRTGLYLGTALYSAPEQLRGGEVTPKSDVYSMGTTLYQATTGQPPFVGAPIEVASQHINREPTPPSAINDAVSSSLDALILDCMKKDPDARPTADDVRLGLLEAGRGAHPTRSYTEAPATAKETRPAPPPPPRPTGPRPGGPTYGGRRRRSGALAVLAVVAVLAVIGALAYTAFQDDSGESAGVNGANNGAGNEAVGDAGNNAQNGDGGGQNPSGAGSGGGGQGAGGQSSSASASASADQQGAGGGQSEGAQAGGGTTAAAAEQTVQEFYTTTSEGEYDRSAELLTESWRQEWFPDRATFEGTFAPVERVEFVEGPNAEVSGNTATVTGETQATLTTEVQRNQGTWYLVRDDGRWKIDSWTVDNLSTQPA